MAGRGMAELMAAGTHTAGATVEGAMAEAVEVITAAVFTGVALAADTEGVAGATEAGGTTKHYEALLNPLTKWALFGLRRKEDCRKNGRHDADCRCRADCCDRPCGVESFGESRQRLCGPSRPLQSSGYLCSSCGSLPGARGGSLCLPRGGREPLLVNLPLLARL